MNDLAVTTHNISWFLNPGLSLYQGVFTDAKIRVTTHNDITLTHFIYETATGTMQILLHLQKEDSLRFPQVLGSSIMHDFAVILREVKTPEPSEKILFVRIPTLTLRSNHQDPPHN